MNLGIFEPKINVLNSPKESWMLRKIAAFVVLLICMWTLSGCHTIHGIGQDIEGGGRAIERSSGK